MKRQTRMKLKSLEIPVYDDYNNMIIPDTTRYPIQFNDGCQFSCSGVI